MERTKPTAYPYRRSTIYGRAMGALSKVARDLRADVRRLGRRFRGLYAPALGKSPYSRQRIEL